MRQRLTLGAAIALVVLVVGAGVTVAASSNGQTNGTQTISVAATGTAQTSPNQMTVQVTVEASGEKAPVVRQRLADNVSQLRTALAEAGIDDDQIRTARYDLDWDDDSFQYRGQHTFTITVSSPNRTGTVIDTAVRNGADTVEDVRFGLSEDARRSLREQALEEAMRNARDKARTLASSSNLTITGVHAVQTGASFDRPRLEFDAAYAKSVSTGTAIERGPVGAQVRVQVVYNATS